MARPRKPGKRDVIRPARFTLEEWRTVCRKAELASLSPCRYLRKAALQHPLRSRLEQKAIYHLGRIGNNLNQLARAANATGRLAEARRLEGAMDELLAALRRIA